MIPINPMVFIGFNISNSANSSSDFNGFQWVTKSYSAVYPRSNLESQNQATNIPVGLPSSPIEIWDKTVQGFLSYDGTN